ncbi:MAG: methyltransferase domain-containing protein [Burkholderiales bacterium]|nr:methyltransferase domain-containing protein [Burkholderiales bacterium]
MRLAISACLALAAASAIAQSWAWDDGTTPFVVSPPDVVERMLRLAAPKPGERLVDLGSGDGRIVIEAAKRYGAQGLGVDIDPRLVRLASENARRAGVEALARFEVRDLFETDLRGVQVVTLYLLPDVNRKLLPKLFAELAPGARVVSHDYDMGPWPFDEMIELPLAEKLVGPPGRSRIYLWVMPADARGTWLAELPGHGGRWRFAIAQRYQLLEVEASVAEGTVAVRGARLRGDEIRLAVVGTVGGRGFVHLFRGRVAGARIAGEVEISDGETSRTLPWNATRE